MSVYLEQLGENASIDIVFTDIHGRAKSLIDELNKLRIGGLQGSTNNKDVPGTPLRFNWGGSRGNGDDWFNSTHLDCVDGWDTTSLLQTTVLLDAPTIAGSSVGAYRGTEISPDYLLSYRQSRNIECRLGTFGLKGMNPNDEPRGTSVFDPGETIGSLGAEDTQRLTLVTQGILDNLTAIEWIRDGQKPKEVFDAMGKPLPSLSMT